MYGMCRKNQSKVVLYTALFLNPISPSLYHFIYYKGDKKYPCLRGNRNIMMIFQLTAAFLIRFVFTIFVIITNPRKWDTLSSLGLAGPFFRAAGSTNWKTQKKRNENVVDILRVDTDY